LLIGDAARDEFRVAGDWLAAETALFTSESCAAATARLRETTLPLPHWVVLLAPHRGCAELTGVEDLHAVVPLARLVCLTGAWCEGETRSGTAIRGAMRATWLQFVPRASDALADATRGGYAGWSLPRTATPLDVSLLTRARMSPLSSARPLIAVVTPAREDFSALADALAACGVEAKWSRDGRLTANVQGVVCLGTSLSQGFWNRWGELRQAAEARPLLVLLDFPRWHEVTQLLRQEAAAVIAKPFLLGDLRQALAAAGIFENGETTAAKAG
jgi:hypothetical protein